ncbi:MAG: type II toxin-antitoxin system RelE/ParE family toxin [Caulobacter sp.]|nr:type II toxin-antitoxin system RelE/ParE family toxin [Caulobacter sp.]
MIHDVQLAPRAWRDLARLVDFLAPKSPKAEARARAVLWTAIRSLDQFPDRGTPTSVDHVRALFIPFNRGGYIVTYLLEGDDVIVLRIFHSLEER